MFTLMKWHSLRKEWVNLRQKCSFIRKRWNKVWQLPGIKHSSLFSSDRQRQRKKIVNTVDSRCRSENKSYQTIFFLLPLDKSCHEKSVLLISTFRRTPFPKQRQNSTFYVFFPTTFLIFKKNEILNQSECTERLLQDCCMLAFAQLCFFSFKPTPSLLSSQFCVWVRCPTASEGLAREHR